MHILSIKIGALLNLAQFWPFFDKKFGPNFPPPPGVEVNQTHFCIPLWVLYNTPLKLFALSTSKINFHILRYGSSACISVSGGHIGFDCSYLMPSNWDVHLGFFSSLGTYLAIEKQKLPQLKNVYRT